MTAIDRSGERIDWSFVRGDTWVFDFQLNVATTASPVTGEPADLSGSSWLLQVRESGSSGDGALFATAVMTTSQQASGYVLGTVAATATESATHGKKVYEYDLEQNVGGLVATPVWGYVTVRPDASKD